ncbi:unnamed protein product [Scytosiphon promiscuus]
MKTSAANGYLRGLLLFSVSVGPVGCFIVGSGGSIRSAQQQHQRRPSRSVDRPLHKLHYDSGRREAFVAHACGRAAGGGAPSLCAERSLSTRRRAGATAGMNRLRQQGVRLSAAAAAAAAAEGDGDAEEEDEQDGGAKAGAGIKEGALDVEAELEGDYTPEERDFIRTFYEEYEAAEEPQPDEDERAVFSHDYKMYAGEGGTLDIEWDAAVGKVDTWNLPPREEYDPKVVPVHYKYYEDDLQANLKSEVNPFPLHSEWADREVKVGHIDEDKKEAIQPMMSVIEQVCELIDTTDDVFSFKYVGPIRHKKGIASWAMVLIKPLYPEVKGVEFVTNRTRDRTDW